MLDRLIDVAPLAEEAAKDPAVLAAAEDYERRVAEGRPYEGAEDVEVLIADWLAIDT